MGLALSLGLSVSQVGCKSYSENLSSVRHAVQAGEPEAGLERIDKMLKLRKPTDLPRKWKGEVPLMMLERATLQQAVGMYDPSKVNFSAVEQELEMLDFSRDAPGKISEYMLNGSAKKYKTTPIEKLFLNSLNLLNYLATGDLGGARVEARRWRSMRDYLRDADQGNALALGGGYGAFLAGYVFEQSNRPDQAMRYYAEALKLVSLPFLSPWIAKLAKKSAYRTPEIEAAIAQGEAAPLDPKQSELLVVAQVGQVPYREAKRVPVGLAVGLAAQFFVGSPALLERGLTKFVNYPELVVPSDGPRQAELVVGGQRWPMPMVANASLAVQKEFDKIRPRIVAAALSRALGRAAIAYGVEEGTNAARGDSRSNGILGFLVGAAVEASMVAADKPDTRSWSVLPGYYFVTRVVLPPGVHNIELRLAPSGTTYAQRVELAAGESQLLLLSGYLE